MRKVFLIISLTRLSKEVHFTSANQRLKWEIRVYLENKALFIYIFVWLLVFFFPLPSYSLFI